MVLKFICSNGWEQYLEGNDAKGAILESKNMNENDIECRKQPYFNPR